MIKPITRTVGRKIALGVGSIVALALITLLLIYAGMKSSGSALARMKEVDEPTSAAAYEMEINVVEIGLKVMKYLQNGVPAHRAGALKDKRDFDRYFKEYERLAHNPDEIALSREVGALHAPYWKLATQLMDQRDERENLYAQSVEGSSKLDGLLHSEIERQSTGAPATRSRRELLLALAASLGEMGQALGAYLRLGQPQFKAQLDMELDEFSKHLASYRKLAPSNSAEAMTESFKSLRRDAEQAALVHDAMNQGLAQFFTLRTQLDDVLDERIRKSAQQHLQASTADALSMNAAVRTQAVILTLLTIALGLAVGYLLVIGVTRPARALSAGAHAIGTGHLEHRIPDLGQDELGDVARQFNGMATRLQATTVSRDALEASQAALRESDERYRRAVLGANDGLFDWDQAADKVYYSPRWKAMLGYAGLEIGDSPKEWLGRVHPQDLPALQLRIASESAQAGAPFQADYRMCQKNGDYLWVQCRAFIVRHSSSGTGHLAGSQTDIHARKASEQRLVHDALHDELTGLPNRSLLTDRLQHSIALAKREKDTMFALLFLDLDGFKQVNDALGHPAGDRLLAAFAKRIGASLRSSDTLARFGGDEFAILLSHVRDTQEVDMIANRLQLDVRLPFDLGGGPGVFVGASVGIALSTMNYTRALDMMRDADLAMYRAKAAGKGRHVTFDLSMRADSAARMELEAQLRQALEREEFEIHYQPLVKLQGASATLGFEAQLRWQRPGVGLVAPAEFIGTLEEIGLIVPVGRWLLRRACAAVRSWRQPGFEPSLAINISAVQMREPGLMVEIDQALADSGLAARSLTLEVTEDAVTRNEVAARALLLQAKQRGVQLSTDDFGTGHSSLSYLRRFPWDWVKIDRTVTGALPLDSTQGSVALAIIGMARALNIKTVAEGVQSVEQFNFMRGHGVDAAQGYLFGQPMPAAHWAALSPQAIQGSLRQAGIPA